MGLIGHADIVGAEGDFVVGDIFAVLHVFALEC